MATESPDWGISRVATPVQAPLESLSPAQRQMIAQAERERRRILRAGALAAFNGWSLVIFAGVTILFGHDPLSIALTVAFGVAGYRELRGRQLIRRMDPSGARLLGYNQILLAGIVAAYCGWCIALYLIWPQASLHNVQNLIASPQDLTLLPPAMRRQAVFWRDHASEVVAGVYGLIILVSLVTQALMALYYFTREPAMRHYLERTPAWVVQMQRAMRG